MTIRSFGVAVCAALTMLAASAAATDAPPPSAGPAVLVADIQPLTTPTPPPHPKPKPTTTNTKTPGTCSAAFTHGVIGGVSKCLAAGQQCQQAHAADYPKYGFTCSAVKGKWLLSKKGGTTTHTGVRSTPPHPSTTSSTPPKKKP